VDIGNGVSKVEMDIQSDCWSPRHIKWLLSLDKHLLVTAYSHANDGLLRDRNSTSRFYHSAQE